MFNFSLQELVVLMLIIAMLSMSGLWPRIIRGLRELKGDHFDDSPPPPPRGGDSDLYFQILGLSPSASWEEIERAYRTKAKIHHPDHGGDEDAMRTLNEAYARLKRLKKR